MIENNQNSDSLIAPCEPITIRFAFPIGAEVESVWGFRGYIRTASVDEGNIIQYYIETGSPKTTQWVKECYLRQSNLDFGDFNIYPPLNALDEDIDEDIDE